MSLSVAWTLFKNPVLLLIITAVLCCTCCALMTGKFVFIIIGLYIVAAVLTQFLVSFITSFIGIKHALYLFVLWALTVVIMQLDILMDCFTMNSTTFQISATNALGGSIAAAVAMLVIDIVLSVIPITKAFFKIVGIIPIIGPAMVSMIDAQVLMIFNLIFGMGVARNVALSQACPSTPAPTTETKSTTAEKK